MRRPAEDPAARLEDWSPGLLKSRAYEQVLLDIIFGELAPGERIDEHYLAARYESGLAGIREALARLALEDLVQRRPRVGTVVAPLDILEAKQSYDARQLIECHCAELAASHATRAEIAAIATAFEGAEAAISRNDSRALVAMDEAFHLGVAAASHNRTLARMVAPLHHKAARFWICAKQPEGRKDQLHDLALHRAVTNAVARHDGPAAREAMAASLGEFPYLVQ
ncbi:MAG TPA: GntR family transcriptional regulator [Rhizomicrobium sp.]|nr:GntR family transcriptional regulator [Rhizomicrobium sp.]